MFLDVKHLRYLLVRLLLEDVQVEHRAASVGQLGHQLHQFFFGEAGAGFGQALVVRHVGQLFFVHHQLGEALPAAQMVDALRHHHPGHPRAQRTLPSKGEVGENLDEAIVQYVMGRIDIARIAVAHRQHLLGIKGVQLFSGRIFSSPAALYQFQFVFQCQCLFTDVRCVVCQLDAAFGGMLQDYMQKEVKVGHLPYSSALSILI